MTRAGVVAAALAWIGCVGHGAAPVADAVPAPLVASQQMPGDFVLQQRLAFRWSGGEGRVDAAVQSACGELTVVLLTPFGTPDTVIRQRGWQVEVSGRRAAKLPFAPERILLDVQRSYVVLSPAPLDDGTHEHSLRGERVEERWEGGRLAERVFHPEGEGVVTVRYAADADALSLDDSRFGYHLDVTTLSRTPVDCKGDDR